MPEQRDLSGVVQPGRGLGAGLMAERNVMEKLEELIGFPVVPGTLNVRLPRPLERGSTWRYLPAAEIAPDRDRIGSRVRASEAGCPPTCTAPDPAPTFPRSLQMCT
jgi:CTP-dependent riboflavin kinase